MNSEQKKNPISGVIMGCFSSNSMIITVPKKKVDESD